MLTPEPHRVDTSRVPLGLFIRPCSTDPRLYDIVDETGEFIARQVPDINTARVLAAAPRLLDGFYEMRWRLTCWFVHGYGGVGLSDRRDELEARTEEWLERMADIEEDACAMDGRFPL